MAEFHISIQLTLKKKNLKFFLAFDMRVLHHTD